MLVSFVRGKPYLPGWLRDAAVRIGFLVSTTMFLMVARIKVMGAQLPVFTRFDNPASVSPTPTRQLTFNYLLPVNAWLLLYPADLCCDWTMGTIPVVSGLLDTRNVATLCFYVCVIKLITYGLHQRGQRARAVIMVSHLQANPTNHNNSFTILGKIYHNIIIKYKQNSTTIHVSVLIVN